MRGVLLLVGTIAAQAQSFEVASVRPHALSVDQPLIKAPDADPVHVSGDRVTLKAISLKGLVMAAYGVKEYQVSGGPAWASRIDSVFDVAAKAPGSAVPSGEQVRAMLQSLLTERFHLKLRRGSKQLPVYNLVVGKGGSKMRVASGDAPAPGMRRGSMDQLAALLSLMLDRPVIDKTGLAGVHDYSGSLALLDTGAQDSADTISLTLAAIQEQLGLRAEAARSNIEMLTIESADRPSAD